VASRTYRSELRESQAEATRQRILDALAEVMADGVAALSVPLVAKRAGVSVGTVYRHFGDKAELVAALMPHAARRTGTVIDSSPSTIEEMDDLVHKVFRHFESADDLIRAAFASRMGRDVRLDWSEARLDTMKEVFRRLDSDLTPEKTEHLSRTALILTTSDTYREWKERLDLTPDEAADEVMWTIRTLLRGVRS
jgi:AcrR family transcriptional regulator